MKLTKIMILTCFFSSLTANAAVLNYSGSVTDGTGALVSLVPIDSTIAGFFEYDFSGSPAEWSNPDNLLSARVILTNTTTGNELFCFNFNQACPVTGPAEVPIVSVISLSVLESGAGNPIVEAMEVLAFSATLTVNFPIVFDFIDQSFSVDAGFLGMINGVGTLTQVPVPGAIWLFLSAFALLGRTTNKMM